MDDIPASIDGELLDLSTVDVTTLRSVPRADLAAGIDRAGARIADSQGSISGYSTSYSDFVRPRGTAAEDESI